MAFKIEKTFSTKHGAVHVEIGRHFMIEGRKGHAVNLGRKYVEVLIYGGPRVKIDPTVNRPLATSHQ